MSKQTKGYRHGEVFLLPVSKLPRGKKEQHNTYIVGHSESGHHHVLESDTKFDVIMDGLELYLSLGTDALLSHKKTVNRHNDIKVKPGLYKVIPKKEYNPFTKVMEQVWD